jgi:hypothetical protein
MVFPYSWDPKLVFFSLTTFQSSLVASYISSRVIVVIVCSGNEQGEFCLYDLSNDYIILISVLENAG